MGNEGAEGQERVFNVGILGSNHEITKIVGECLGTPDEITDLQFFNRLDTSLGYIFTGVAPVGYPEKLKTLIQACSLTEIHIMVLDAETGITPAIGEIMICMDLYARYYNTKILGVIGNITNANEWRVADIIQKFPKIAKGMNIKKFPSLILYKEIKQILKHSGLLENKKTKDLNKKIKLKFAEVR